MQSHSLRASEGLRLWRLRDCEPMIQILYIDVTSKLKGSLAVAESSYDSETVRL